jgi:DNA-binding NtrC family response regulator
MSNFDPSATQTIQTVSRADRTISVDCIELELVSGPDAGLRSRLPLAAVTIGTAPDNDVVLTDRTVSRYHAEIKVTSEGVLVRDLGSTNGSFSNDLRVVEAYVEPSARLSLGKSEIQIQRTTEERSYQISDADRIGGLIGRTGPMRELYGLLTAVAPTPMTVLISGESGSGKKMVATTLHELSGRSGPLVVFDHSVTDPEMVRSDLFGHIKGAFTGASGAREGEFRRADSGTLFIDEIGELPLELQPRLLRALENREVAPVGSDRPQKVDVRVIAATNRDLDSMVRDGAFGADLFYRLSVITVQVPSLRDIKEDIPLLIQHFSDKLGLPCRLSAEALDLLQSYHWPGNVRELRNVLERASVLCRGGEILPEHLRLAEPGPSSPVSPVAQHARPRSPAISPAQLRELERQMINEAMEHNGNNKAAVARELGIPLSTLKRRIAEFGL